ncbi:molybdopterin molybdotransferase MoeA [Sphingopyxis macrogoltabida]|uniref:Molybdopterin molybdenumtransferase n=1 Tax=Sphingopyxis macrogoltabida TaxID=33050 RepID=A0AAC8Z1E6_SPHMC|nr:molybdopterin molybdotransferase MoeA [Sphingopyxis macrogoltabida]ALJ12736.1 molybdenum cofactor biosynthesis protein MoeA [Sphingopyxis macrogoltabida]AMU89797.1 molybdenum cofactor biosynthesis protein MoeA [Sphingopyxis macrogoltabida]
MSGLLAVEEAQARLLALRAPLAAENIAISESLGRYLSQDVIASRDQPAAPLSAMDGYAIRFADMPGPWTITGEIAAGAAPDRTVGAGEAIRIFTGAMLPDGADTVILQEDVAAAGTALTLTGDGPGTRGRHIRERAGDFAAGARLLAAGTHMGAGAIAAAIMGGAGEVRVGSRPRVAILTTGDELVAPGRALAPGQIPNSNGAMLAAMLAAVPADVALPLHMRDDRMSIANAIKELARHHDVIVTVGGASVGDHDHVRGALDDAGGRLDFWKIAMRPGKPLIAGTIGETLLLGLPGNPGSAFVTATLFLLPLIRHLAGAAHPLPPIRQAPLAAALAAGGARRDYLRARVDGAALHMFDSQDSGQTVPLIEADALLIREIGAPARAAGAIADYIAIA